ncbi:hypothetical protein [Campylobacter hyointestinalis]|uniref:hypothetical protein n=1 Tax=Campylobacter hyointestinalis TaxID=198 RepID=UPI000DCB3B10|nr:hypothetical protein [Campylobacter hyointestinalis]RAZ25862.1 hypothetical protein CHL9752_01905 [Campylobacter hyointestinalis subsp. lawsonii]RAZ39972.1 hypothetical protein CHL9426_01750 [Campylobacter hyointestinalis subsp. lawsonii]
MKKIFIFMICVLFGIELYGGENEFLIVNDQFNKDGDSKNLYTQIVGKSFNTKLISHYQNNNNNDISSISIALYSKNIEVAVVSTKQDIQSIILALNSSKTKSLHIFDLEPLIIQSDREDLDYKDMKFKIIVEYKNPEKSEEYISDTFSVRPAKFKINSIANEILIGAKEYDSKKFEIFEALGYDDKIAKSYNINLDDGSSSVYFDRSKKDGECQILDENKVLKDIEPNLLSNNEKYQFKFEKGKGRLYVFDECKSDEFKGKKECFIYPDIGDTKVKIVDSTSSDAKKNSCIPNDNSNEPKDGKIGKIGCNVENEAEFYKFIPNSIKLVKKEITNFYNSISYFSSNGNNFALDKDKFENLMSASLNLGFEARLADESVPKLYSANCYANSIEFSLKYDQNKDDQNIKFYGVKEKTDGAALRIDDKFVVDESEFNGGKSNTKVKFSLDKSSSPRNLVLVKNDKIRAENLTEGYLKDNKFEAIENGVNIIQNDKFDESYAKFFYGSLIVPDVFLDNLQNNKQTVTAYYSVFCDDECISNIVEPEQNRDIYRQTIEQVIGQTSSDKKKVPKNKGFYITEFMGEDIINTEYKTKDKEEKKDKEVTLDSRQFNKGVEQVEFSYSPNKFVAKAIEFTPYVKDGVKTIATWLMEDEKEVGIFNVEFSTKSQWHGAGAEGKVMGIKDADESKARRQQRIDW